MSSEKNQIQEDQRVSIEPNPDDLGLEKVETKTPFDTVAPSAIGGDYHDLPVGYYTSSKFIGTFIGVVFMAWSLYVGYVLPANTLAIINADLGMTHVEGQSSWLTLSRYCSQDHLQTTY